MGKKGDRRRDDKDFARRGWTVGVFLPSLSSAASSSHATGLSAGLVRAVFNGRMAAGMAKKDLPGGRPNIALSTYDCESDFSKFSYGLFFSSTELIL